MAIARALREISTLLFVRGDNPFKARAFDRGATAIEAFTGDLDSLDREHKLHEISDIGRTLAALIHEMLIAPRSRSMATDAGSISNRVGSAPHANARSGS